MTDKFKAVAKDGHYVEFDTYDEAGVRKVIRLHCVNEQCTDRLAATLNFQVITIEVETPFE